MGESQQEVAQSSQHPEKSPTKQKYIYQRNKSEDQNVERARPRTPIWLKNMKKPKQEIINKIQQEKA